MTPEQLAALGTALAAFLRPFQPCFTQQRTADHLHTYCRGLGAVGLIDETSVVKSGANTPSVQRPYLGGVGKGDNGIVTVHLGVCKGRCKTLLDADLYLPRSWHADRPRCRQAGIPEAKKQKPIHGTIKVALYYWEARPTCGTSVPG